MADYIPTVAELKLRAGIILYRGEEDEEPTFPCFLYRFCSHDELGVCPWCKTPPCVQDVARAAWAKDHPIFLGKKKAWMARMRKKEKEEEERMQKRLRVLSPDEEQKVIEKEMENKRKEEEKKKEEEKAGRSERDWVNVLD